MDEAPEGFRPPRVMPSQPRSSASVMLSRVSGSGHEILMGKRSPELPAFPDLWSFPGGGVSSVDRKSAEVHPDWLPNKKKDRVATFTLLREMVEEIGISPDGNGGFVGRIINHFLTDRIFFIIVYITIFALGVRLIWTGV